MAQRFDDGSALRFVRSAGESEADAAGIIFDYRCPKRRACSNCKCGERIEEVSLKSEREQCAIDSSVSVDFKNGRMEALLPFMEDPTIKLIPNENIAMSVYKQQTKKLEKDPVAREPVLKSEKKLQEAGHVEWVSNLSADEQKMFSRRPAKEERVFSRYSHLPQHEQQREKKQKAVASEASSKRLAVKRQQAEARRLAEVNKAKKRRKGKHLKHSH